MIACPELESSGKVVSFCCCLVLRNLVVGERPYQCDDLHESPEGEEDTEQHRDGSMALVLMRDYGSSIEPSATRSQL